MAHRIIRPATVAAAVLIATAGLTACGSSSHKSSSSASAAATVTTPTTATAPTTTTTTSTTTPATSTTAPPASGNVTEIGTRKTQDGTLITGAASRTVYFFRPDKKTTTQHAKNSACYAACATVWPPVLATNMPTATGKAESAQLGLTSRKDGTKQVTYNGLPLYYYLKDTKAGEVTGNRLTDAFGFWGALQPNGQMASSG